MNAILESQPGSVQEHLRDIKGFVLERLVDLRRLLRADATTVRAELRKHVRAITIFPDERGWRVVGRWNLLGGSEKLGSMERAGGRIPTVLRLLVHFKTPLRRTA